MLGKMDSVASMDEEEGLSDDGVEDWEMSRRWAKRGWLEKAGLHNTAMKRRLFVLDLEGNLRYYRDAKDIKPAGVILVRGAEVHPRAESMMHIAPCNTTRLYVIAAPDVTIRNAWVRELRRASGDRITGSQKEHASAYLRDSVLRVSADESGLIMREQRRLAVEDNMKLLLKAAPSAETAQRVAICRLVLLHDQMGAAFRVWCVAAGAVLLPAERDGVFAGGKQGCALPASGAPPSPDVHAPPSRAQVADALLEPRDCLARLEQGGGAAGDARQGLHHRA